jgi:hypothetical protein
LLARHRIGQIAGSASPEAAVLRESAAYLALEVADRNCGVEGRPLSEPLEHSFLLAQALGVIKGITKGWSYRKLGGDHGDCLKANRLTCYHTKGSLGTKPGYAMSSCGERNGRKSWSSATMVIPVTVTGHLAAVPVEHDHPPRVLPAP